MKLHSIAKNENRQINEGVFKVWKYRGETLAVLLDRFREEHQFPGTVPMTYAGRLDPMAEGEMIVLTNDARFEKEKYMGLDKTYRFQVVFGVASDTYDVLGIISGVAFIPIDTEMVATAIQKIKTTPLPYPPYSSKPVKGISLFAHARNNTLPEVLPMQSGVIDTISLIKVETIALQELVGGVVKDVKKVQGDFRQDEIIKGWQEIQKAYPDIQASVATFETTVPSGVYIRSIAHEIGKMISVPALAYSIVRTKIDNI